MLCNKCCVNRNTKEHFFGTLLADRGGREDKGRKSLSKGWRLMKTTHYTTCPPIQARRPESQGQKGKAQRMQEG